MIIRELLADESNYTAVGARTIEYLVIHFTANDGDTAQENCNYFTGSNRGASAHYFVDASEVWRSVRDEDRAWHCGDDVYYHPRCRNTNSIGIELCSRRDAAGNFYFTPETVALAVELVRAKMDEYGIPSENIVRHYDVTHKICPAPFVAAGYNDATGAFHKIGTEATAWAEFKAALTQNEQEDEDMAKFKTIKDAPEWAQPTLQKLIDKKALAGDGNGNINVTETFCKTFVILDRLGKL